MLLICPVRPGDRNEELRYALRSWEANLLLPGGLELLVVGHCPPWLQPDQFVSGNRVRSMPHAVFDNVLLASEIAAGDGHESALYMNDDFFCLDPMDSVLPVRRNISLEQQAAAFPQSSTLWWPASLRLTASWLASEGFPHPDSYEVHRPLLAAPSGMVSALSRWQNSPDAEVSNTVPQWRTVYGTLNKVDAVPVPDVKVGTRFKGFGSPWLSTEDQTWRLFQHEMAKRFQKPSRWEV